MPENEPVAPTTSEEIHFSLQGFYHALLVSVCDPICVPSGFSIGGQYEKMFYDVVDDEAEAHGIMRRRLRTHADLIRSFMEQHGEMVDALASIEEAANTKSPQTKAYARTFSELYAQHIAMIHELRTNPEITDVFLDFPFAATMARSDRWIRNIIFNATKDHSGAMREQNKLERLLSELEPQDVIAFGQLDTTGMPYSGQMQGSWLDTSYRGRYEFVTQMLEEQLHFK